MMADLPEYENFDRVLHQRLNDIFRKRGLNTYSQTKEFLRVLYMDRFTDTLQILLRQEPILSRHFSAKNLNKLSLLWIAILGRYWNSAELLVRSGADVNKLYGLQEGYRLCLNKKSTVLHALLQMNESLENEQLIRLVIHYGANLQARDSNGQTILHCTVKYDRAQMFGMLIKKRADLQAQNSLGQTALHLAVEKGRVQMAKMLLEKGAEVNIADNNGVTPLHEAASNDNAEQLLPMLIKYGADLQAQDFLGRTALHFTAMKDRVKPIGILLEKGADLQAQNSWGQTVLHLAIERGRVQMTKMLLEKGADVNAADYNWMKPLLEAAANSSESDKLLPLLVKHGADLRARDSKGQTALHFAAKKGQVHIAEMLIRKGVDFQAQDFKGQTALHLAVMTGLVQMVKMLLQNGANANIPDGRGVTPLFTLTEGRHQEELLPMLIKHGADLQARDSNGQTILHCAVKYNRAQMFGMLLKKRANLQAQNSLGQTALHLAVEKGRVQMVKRLLEKGAEVNIADNNGVTPLHEAASNDNAQELLPILIKHGADLQARDFLGRTALHFTAMKGRIKPIGILLENGADLQAQNSWGQTVLHSAIERGLVSMTKMLLEKGADVNIADNNCMTSLLEAAASSSEVDKLLPLLVKHGANLRAQDLKGQTALHFVAKKGQIHMAEMLIQKGADLEARDFQGQTALHFAVMEGLVQMAEMLIKYGANFLVRNLHGQNVLHLLSLGRVDHTELARLLIERGVPLDDECHNQCKPIHLAVTTRKNELVKLYLDHGVNVNSLTQQRQSLLYLAATIIKNTAVLETLLERGVDIDYKTPSDGCTALHGACLIDMDDEGKNIETLLFAGADVTIKNRNGDTAFALNVRRRNMASPHIKLMIRLLSLKKACQSSSELTSDERLIERKRRLRVYYRGCLEQIEKMKAKRIIKTCTFFELLTKCHCRIAELMRNPQFKINFENFDLYEFSEYFEDILRAFERAQNRYQSMLEQEDLVNEAFYATLPYVVVRKVVHHAFHCCENAK